MNFAALIELSSTIAHPSLLYVLLPGVLLLCAFGLPLPEDIVLITGGYLSYLGLINPWIFLPLSFIGVLAGDIIIFKIGSNLGYKFLKHRLMARFLTESRIRRAACFIERYHDKIFFIARFLPGLRAAIFFTGGALKTCFRKFLLFDSLAAVLSVPLFVLGAYLGGGYINRILIAAKNITHVLMALSALIIIAGSVWFIRRQLAKRNKAV